MGAPELEARLNGRIPPMGKVGIHSKSRRKSSRTEECGVFGALVVRPSNETLEFWGLRKSSDVSHPEPVHAAHKGPGDLGENRGGN